MSKVPHSVHSALSESYLAVALSVLLHDAFNVSSWKMNFLRLANGLWQPQSSHPDPLAPSTSVIEANYSY